FRWINRSCAYNRNNSEIRHFRLSQKLAHRDIAGEVLREAAVFFNFKKVKKARFPQICFDQHRSGSSMSKRDGNIDGCGSLSFARLTAGYKDDLVALSERRQNNRCSQMPVGFSHIRIGDIEG